MTLKGQLTRKWNAALLGAALTAAVGLLLLLTNSWIGENLVHLSYDLPFRHRAPVRPNEAVLVYLDDDSHQELAQPYDAPWDRGLYGRLLERLTKEGARAVSFDIIFSSTNSQHPEGDDRFAREIKANGRVVLGTEYTTATVGGMTATRMIRPIDPFFDAAAGWGMVQLTPDQDFIVRRHLHVPPSKDDDIYSSISWEVARVAGAPATANPGERARERWLNYYGPPGAIPHIAFHAALEPGEHCPTGFFSNKVVFVGAKLKTYYSGQRKDELRTPYTRKVFGPAVDVQATQVLNLVRGDWLTRTSMTAEVLSVLLAGIVFGAGLTRVRPLPAMGVAAVGMALVAGIAQFLFVRQRVWFPWMIVAAAQIPAAALWSVLFNSVRLYVENRLYEESLRMYLSPKLVKKFASDRELLKPGARKQTVTALFTDIANFTSISEGMDSDELARGMNTYFGTAVSQCIHATDGTVVKYIGDAVFAFWNAPEAQPDHAFRACDAALRFLELPTQQLNGRPLVTRLGLHTGIANVGNFGSSSRIDYTAIGEAINLASRMEALNKHLETHILITGETLACLESRLKTRALGRFRLKGFEKTVEVHELTGRAGNGHGSASPPAPDPGEADLCDRFGEALRVFQRGDLPAARAAFDSVLKAHPADGPSRFYLKQIEALLDHPPAGGWVPVIELAEK